MRYSPRDTIHRTPAVAFAVVGLLVACVCVGHAGSVSGSVEYTDRLYDQNGFTGSTSTLPVRQAYVTAFNVTNLGTGAGYYLDADVLDNNGDFSLSWAATGTLNLRIWVWPTSLQMTFGSFTVNNNLYEHHVSHDSSSLGSVNGRGWGVDGWDLATDYNVGTLVFSLADSHWYNIFDAGVNSQNLVRNVGPTTEPKLLYLIWDTTFGGTYFMDMGTWGCIALETTSPFDAGWTDDVILHEIGHYVMSAHVHGDSPGGFHYINGHNDIRQSWSEGWAGYWSAATRQHFGGFNSDWFSVPTGTGTTSYAYSLEAPSWLTTSQQSCSEVSVQACLYDVIDPADEPEDTLAGTRQQVWDTATGIGSERSAVFEDFWEIWSGTQSAANVTAFRNIMADRSIEFLRDSSNPILMADEIEPEVAVPDGSGSVTRILPVATHLNETVTRVMCYVDVEHSQESDLLITLSHGGVTRQLHNRTDLKNPEDPGSPPGERWDVVNWYNMPNTWWVSPAEALSTFNGQNSEGNWTLTVYDQVSGTSGQLREWKLYIAPTPTVANIADPRAAQHDGLLCLSLSAEGAVAGYRLSQGRRPSGRFSVLDELVPLSGLTVRDGRIVLRRPVDPTAGSYYRVTPISFAGEPLLPVTVRATSPAAAADPQVQH